jgi:ATP-dependent helicase HrpA
MARLPVDVKLARMLIAANDRGCLREMLAITAFLGIQDPRERPPTSAVRPTCATRIRGPEVRVRRHRQVVGRLSAGARRPHAIEAAPVGEKHFLGFLRLREWRELHRQLKLLCDELGWNQNAEDAPYADLHRALLTGLPTQVGNRGDRNIYDGPRGRKFQLFPGSPLAKKAAAVGVVGDLARHRARVGR